MTTEHPGITILRKIRQNVVGFYMGTFGKHAEPYLTELVEWIDERAPRPIGMEQEVRNAVNLHKLLDPELRNQRCLRLSSNEVQITLTNREYFAILQAVGKAVGDATSDRDEAKINENVKLLELMHEGTYSAPVSYARI